MRRSSQLLCGFALVAACGAAITAHAQLLPPLQPFEPLQPMQPMQPFRPLAPLRPLPGFPDMPQMPQMPPMANFGGFGAGGPGGVYAGSSSTASSTGAGGAGGSSTTSSTTNNRAAGGSVTSSFSSSFGGASTTPGCTVVQETSGESQGSSGDGSTSCRLSQRVEVCNSANPNSKGHVRAVASINGQEATCCVALQKVDTKALQMFCAAPKRSGNYLRMPAAGTTVDLKPACSSSLTGQQPGVATAAGSLACTGEAHMQVGGGDCVILGWAFGCSSLRAARSGCSAPATVCLHHLLDALVNVVTTTCKSFPLNPNMCWCCRRCCCAAVLQ